ncbi:hypothetical protein DICPUDRAFT_80849 [Dictyostelium purpureum]|uniref:FNIP repeat-containing protein n=1 Tax=Dictyostelium purpureum TaxID=5786 RepID=F0ZRQ6_DICPU|nr:uncharacterized protein DICPUDRAFT_80849 [Dictyostelium purpureum]EGC33381.1 hypothetical protein DICPUDRAFT_80849 [Dictyostelium purpureum]|eukprot:XP_003290089.1 hypothetical protein DICPUDRAFT_80849 [Dictyostelium purpureum]
MTRDIGVLYRIVFNNIHIYSIIKKHLRLFNFFYGTRYFSSVEEFYQFKFIQYLSCIMVDIKETFDLNQLPPNIRSIEIFSIYKKCEIIPLTKDSSNSLKKIKIIGYHSKPKIKHIIKHNNIVGFGCNLWNVRNLVFPNTIRKLDITYNTTIKKGWLPQNLTKLSISLPRKTAIEDYALPNSLKELSIDFELGNNDIKMELKSNYLTHLTNLEKFTLNHNSCEENLLSDDFQIPESVTKLALFCEKLPESFNLEVDFNIKLRSNMFPPNLTHLTMCHPDYPKFNNGGYPLIEENIFPNTLTYLNIGDNFNQDIGINVLPHQLKTLKLGNRYNKKIIKESIPPTLEYFEIGYSLEYVEQPILLNCVFNCFDYYKQFQSSPTLLKSLIVRTPYRLSASDFTEMIKDKTNLEYLELDFFFDLEIEQISLPPNNKIKTLVFNNSNYTKILNLDYFPNLQVLILKNSSSPIITTSNIDNLNITIEIPITNANTLNLIDPIFHRFIKLTKKRIKYL